MASLSLSGAVGGAAKGLSSFLSDQLKNERAVALEEMKAQNRRETNRMDAEMRADLAMKRDKQKYEYDLELLKRGGGSDQPAAVKLAKAWQEAVPGMSMEEALNRATSTRTDSPQNMFSDLVKDLATADPFAAREDPNGIRDTALQFTQMAFPDFNPGTPRGGEPPAAPTAGAATPPSAPQGGSPFIQATDGSPVSEDMFRRHIEAVKSGSVTRDQFIEAYGDEAASEYLGDPQASAAPVSNAPEESRQPAETAQGENLSLAGLQRAYGGNSEMIEGAGEKVADAGRSVAKAASDGDKIRAFLQYRRAKVPLEEMPRNVLEAYFATLEPDVPIYDEIAAILRPQEQQVAAR